MGCDTFDCVMPTRIGRTGMIYAHTHDGIQKINLKKSEYRKDLGKPDEGCYCYVCTHYTRAYLAHLFHTHEMLGPHLASLHNLHVIVNFTKQLRESILHS
jgi:queuine tRNA-ribosyltransferase